MTSQAEPALPKGVPELLVGLLVLAAFYWRWAFLRQSPLPVGVDGYYYPVQLRALVSHGHLVYPSTPLFFWLAAPFTLVTDEITACKLVAALSSALIAVPAFALGRRLSESSTVGLAAAVFVLTAQSSLYLPGEFAKASLGFTCLLLFIWALLSAQSALGWAILAFALVTAALAHKQAAALALVFAAAELGWRASLNRKLRVAAVAVAGAALVVLLLHQRRELAELLTSPRWSLPMLVRGNRELAFGGDLYAALLIAVAALVSRPWRQPVVVITALMVVACCLPWIDVENAEGLGFRMRLAVVALAAVCVPAAVSMIAAKYRTAAVVGVMAALLLLRPHQPREGVVWAHPRLDLAAKNASTMIDRDKVAVVPDRQLMFMLAWYGVDKAVLEPRGVAPEQRVRVIPLAAMSPASVRGLARARRELPQQLSPVRSAHPDHPDGVVVVDEATWSWINARAP